MTGFMPTERPDGILYWHYKDLRRDTTDAWISLFRQTLKKLDEEQGHFSCLVHFDREALPTPYATKEAIEAMKVIPPNLVMSVAMVSENKMMFNIVRFAMNTVSNIDYIHFFDTDEQAIHWLTECQNVFLAKNLMRYELTSTET
ncbi:MAG: hypothetical protein CL607_22980 [Anaerolineaceae bacterium]|nr:hypothetical protein [Anaerolineaceae bacterium]